jgi:hypothetical protein
MKMDLRLLPTRVLDLGEPGYHSEVIRLVESDGFQIDCYIALSHCWGTSHWIKTTKVTLKSHKRGIPLFSLPQTFQDAVYLARRFATRWLWIDTLCILQDDKVDWLRKSAQIGAVYANVYLTLSAATSTDDSSGIFPDIDKRLDKDNPTPFLVSDTRCHGCPGPSNVVPDINYLESKQTEAYCLAEKTVGFDYKTPDGTAVVFLSLKWMPSSTKSFMLTYRIDKFRRTYDLLDGQLLSQRAWTLQERLLVPRTLHYTSDQMF